MSDFLLELSQNATASKLIKAAGLPIPLPTPLARPKGPATEQLLRDALVVVGGEGALSETLAQLLVIAGANAAVIGPQLAAAFAVPGEAFNKKPRLLGSDELIEGEKAAA